MKITEHMFEKRTTRRRRAKYGVFRPTRRGCHLAPAGEPKLLLRPGVQQVEQGPLWAARDKRCDCIVEVRKNRVTIDR